MLRQPCEDRGILLNRLLMHNLCWLHFFTHGDIHTQWASLAWQIAVHLYCQSITRSESQL